MNITNLKSESEESCIADCPNVGNLQAVLCICFRLGKVGYKYTRGGGESAAMIISLPCVFYTEEMSVKDMCWEEEF